MNTKMENIDPSFFEIIEGDCPIIAAAIHDGHDVRSQVAARLSIREEDRLREEDPYTRIWTTIASNRILCYRSRFEFDLNRNRIISDRFLFYTYFRKFVLIVVFMGIVLSLLPPLLLDGVALLRNARLPTLLESLKTNVFLKTILEKNFHWQCRITCTCGCTSPVHKSRPVVCAWS